MGTVSTKEKQYSSRPVSTEIENQSTFRINKVEMALCHARNNHFYLCCILLQTANVASSSSACAHVCIEGNLNYTINLFTDLVHTVYSMTNFK